MAKHPDSPHTPQSPAYVRRIVRIADFNSQGSNKVEIVARDRPCYGVRVVHFPLYTQLGIQFGQDDTRRFPLRQGQFFDLRVNPERRGVYAVGLTPPASGAVSPDATLLCILMLFFEPPMVFPPLTDSVWDTAPRFWKRFQYTPAAGNTAGIGFYLAKDGPSIGNAQEVNRIVQFERLHIRSSLAGIVQIGDISNPAGFTDQGPGIARRFQFSYPSFVRAVSKDNATLINLNRDLNVVAATDVFPPMDEELQFVASTFGSGICVIGPVNTQLTVVAEWREQYLDYLLP